MKPPAFIQHRFFKPVLGALLTVLCGLLLLCPIGDAWQHASFDYLFRFAGRGATNDVVLVLMDNESHDRLGQTRKQWDRGIHARLLNKLADDGAALVALDVFFGKPRDPATDAELAAAMRRLPRVAVAAKQADASAPDVDAVRPLLPLELFLDPARTNWGVAFLAEDLDRVVRRHWPLPSPGPYPSLPWTMCALLGKEPGETPRERWLRHYAPGTAWTSLSYNFALAQPLNFFRDKIVFIGNKPETTPPDGEDDEFQISFTRWTGAATGGMEVLATEFINLMNDESLERAPGWAEALILAITGALLGAGLRLLRRRAACGAGFAAGLGTLVAAVWFTEHSRFWFPWLVIVGGQLPCALVFALVRRPRTEVSGPKTIILVDAAAKAADGLRLEIPDYELCDQPFGEGSYGKVWLARDAVGHWQALKAVYQAKFGDDRKPYEREFSGLTHYKPISDKHPGLLRVNFISRMKPEGYFYYAMELADSVAPGWEKNPALYQPRDLIAWRDSVGGRLPLRDCVRLGMQLSDALRFLHSQGLTHRDIKPRNILLVRGQPKLADAGLVAEAPSADEQRTWVGTPGYMPPAPEPSGTLAADIYALGMVLYVMGTGLKPSHFPALSTLPVESRDPKRISMFRDVILTACHSDLARRYPSAAALHAALEAVRDAVGEQAIQ